MLNVDDPQMKDVRTMPLSEDVGQSNTNVLEKSDALRNAVADYRMMYAWVTGAVTVTTVSFMALCAIAFGRGRKRNRDSC